MTAPKSRVEAYHAIVAEIREHRDAPSSASAERILMAAADYTFTQEDGYAVRAALIEVASFMHDIRPAVFLQPAPFEDFPSTEEKEHV